MKKEVESCPTAAEPIVISSDDELIEISSDADAEDDETEDNERSINRISKIKLKKLKPIPQFDGPADSSDDEDGVEDDEDGDDDDDDDDDDNDPDGDEEDEGVEEEPLGSEDDISDEDASDLFDTENVVVCQYDKITRARNKWKFHLKVRSSKSFVMILTILFIILGWNHEPQREGLCLRPSQRRC